MRKAKKVPDQFIVKNHGRTDSNVSSIYASESELSRRESMSVNDLRITKKGVLDVETLNNKIDLKGRIAAHLIKRSNHTMVTRYVGFQKIDEDSSLHEFCHYVFGGLKEQPFMSSDPNPGFSMN